MIENIRFNMDTYLSDLSDDLKDATTKQEDELFTKAELVLNIAKYELLVILKDYDYIECISCNNYHSLNDLIELSVNEYICMECSKWIINQLS